ncbi:MAG TPA: CopG family antitoxin [Phycisphaerae bacterium]
MKSRIPKFASEQEEARFWDTHQITDYLDEVEEEPQVVFVRPESRIIEVNESAWRRLQREAKRRRTTPTRLIHRWLNERLAR